MPFISFTEQMSQKRLQTVQEASQICTSLTPYIQSLPHNYHPEDFCIYFDSSKTVIANVLGLYLKLGQINTIHETKK